MNRNEVLGAIDNFDALVEQEVVRLEKMKAQGLNDPLPLDMPHRRADIVTPQDVELAAQLLIRNEALSKLGYKEQADETRAKEVIKTAKEKTYESGTTPEAKVKKPTAKEKEEAKKNSPAPAYVKEKETAKKTK